MKKLFKITLTLIFFTAFQTSPGFAEELNSKSGSNILESGLDLNNFTVPGSTKSEEFESPFNLFFSMQPTDAEEDLLLVSSDAMSGTLTLKAIVDSNGVLQELQYLTSDHVKLDMPLDNLAKGIVLMTASNYDILKLVSHDLNPNSGGKLDLIYLSNGIWNSYVTFPMNLKHDQHWGLETRDTSKANSFNAMYLKKRTVLGKMIGIESVEVSHR